MITETYVSSLDQDQIKRDAKAIVLGLQRKIGSMGWINLMHFLDVWVSFAVRDLPVPQETKKRYPNLIIRIVQKSIMYRSKGSYEPPDSFLPGEYSDREYISLYSIIPDYYMRPDEQREIVASKELQDDEIISIQYQIKYAYPVLVHELTHAQQQHHNRLDGSGYYRQTGGIESFKKYLNQPIERDPHINAILSIVDRAITQERNPSKIRGIHLWPIDKVLAYAESVFPYLSDLSDHKHLTPKSKFRLDLAFRQMMKRRHLPR